MTEIRYKNKIIGLLIRAIPNGSIPQTKAKEPLQLVTLKHSKGKQLAAHMHKPVKLQTKRVQECVFIRKGRIKMDLYGPNKKRFKKITLKVGDVFILQSGGHGFHFLEDSEFIELKNGPKVESKVLI